MDDALKALEARLELAEANARAALSQAGMVGELRSHIDNVSKEIAKVRLADIGHASQIGVLRRELKDFTTALTTRITGIDKRTALLRPNSKGVPALLDIVISPMMQELNDTAASIQSRADGQLKSLSAELRGAIAEVKSLGNAHIEAAAARLMQSARHFGSGYMPTGKAVASSPLEKHLLGTAQ